MDLKWHSLFLYAGIVLVFEVSTCIAGARIPKTSARTLAERTGAAHYEERFEKIASSEDSNEHHKLRKRASDEDLDYEVYQGVVGRPGIDFPILPRIPQTTFSCRTFGNGYFADLETECQVFHICDDGRKISFLCPNGTIFQQSELICDWWFKVNCPASPGHYAESSEMLSRAQGRKSRPTYTKKVENEFYSNRNGYSGNSFNDKNQYPVKKDNNGFDGSVGGRSSQGGRKQKDPKYESEEIPSFENFDFEDISDNAQSKSNAKGKIPTKIDPNDSEMQDVAESASFVGNTQRRNGFNYDSLNEGKKPYDDSRKVYDRSKSDRGRQKYRGEPGTSTKGRNQNIGDNTDEYSSNDGRDSKYISRDRDTITPLDRQTKNLEIESRTAPDLIHQKRPVLSAQSTRDRSNTTPRRLDNSRTTPYYTPTVPTIRASQTFSNGRKDSVQSYSSTTVNPNQLTAESQGSGGKFDADKVTLGPELQQPNQIINIGGNGQGTTFGSPTRTSNGKPNGSSFGITGDFAVSGPPAVTISPQDSTHGSLGHFGVTTSSTDRKPTKDNLGQQTSKPSNSLSGSELNRVPLGTISDSDSQGSIGNIGVTTSSTDRKPIKDVKGQQTSKPSNSLSGSELDRVPLETISGSNSQGNSNETGYSGLSDKTKPTLHDSGDLPGYTYNTPATKVPGDYNGSSLPTQRTDDNVGQPGLSDSVKKDSLTSSGGQKIPAELNIKPSQKGDKAFDKTTGNGYSYETPSVTQNTAIPSKATSDQIPELSSDISTSSSKEPSVVTPTPLVIGMRGTLPTDVANTLPGSSSPVITVNILSDGTYSSGKPSISGSAQISPNSISGESSIKPTTFKPFLSSSGPTYLPKDVTIVSPLSSHSTYSPKDTTTVRSSSAGPTYLPKATSASPLSDSVSEHVSDMIKTLNDLKDDLIVDKDNKASSSKNRIGLEIPPSSGPETLHSLALYFAEEGNNSTTTTTEKDEPTATILADISAVPLSNKTVQQYETLFGLDSTDKTNEPTLPPDFQPNIARSGNDLEAQTSNNLLGDAAGKGETRKIAQVFTNALSAYLENPDSFRKVLSEVRPTEPPSTEENEVTAQPRTTNGYFNKGTAASYLPTGPTTATPPTTTDDLEVLDFSDVTVSTGQRGQSALTDSGTTEAPTTGKPGLKIMDRIPASSLAADKNTKQGKNLRFDSTTDSNQIAVEINKGLGLSTIVPYLAEQDGRPKFPLGPDLSLKSNFESSTTTNLPIIFDLLPPVGGKSNEFETPTVDILPPGFDDDEDTLQRAQSQSFVSSRNRLNKEEIDRISKSGTKIPGHYITRLMSDVSPTTEHPNSWFLDPLTINDGLMNKFKTTTASPYTYLPKVGSTTTEISPVHLDLSSMLNRVQLDDKKADRIGKALPGIPEDLLPPENGMQRIANKVFGGLNESSANHLMNVMKTAEENPTVRRLILLLIQTCGDDDYSKTVEQSRQALLNALIGMDEQFSLEDEIEVIKLKPKQNRRGKSIGASEQNSVQNFRISSTTEYPVTTFRRAADLSSYISTTTAFPSTTETNIISSTQNYLDETTRFEIRVEDPEEITSTTATTEPDLGISTTITTKPSSSSSSQETTTISYNIGEAPISGTSVPVLVVSSVKAGSRRRTKDLNNSLSQPSNLSHKSSDERALELLKSLYSLASKFGRR